MSEIARKFRLGNLVVNFAGGAGAGACPLHTLKFTPYCCMAHTWHCPPFSHCLMNTCGAFSPCGVTYLECEGASMPCLGSDLPFDKISPIINEVIPQITDHELILALRRDLEVAVASAKKQEEILTVAAKPQTLEEASEIEESLNKALTEVRTIKAKMEKEKK